ncbi:Gfo/Idh/MocA family oxidoreductase [Ornithinimicrobium cavernae]|uniref:Gfo/Idh/MocA family protein n=1 Tax=Ornithinimicrobium cavernae TaxID=2666047 RepID=UPI000D68E507|nr:Gfo/Idh/MocA family oxidoreductase [Ornithinimicrobium cavernae]
MADVRWAVAGYGVGGRVFHAPMIESASGLELVAVVSTNRDRARDAARAGLEVVSDIEALEALGVEGVTITTPAGTHVDLAHRALDSGLHVVVDKPFALDAASARSVVEHAQDVGRVLTVYQNRRWDGDYLTISSLVRANALGTVRRFTSRIERFRPELPAWNTRAPAGEGGGTLVDLGPHLIDQATHLFGRARSVYAELSQFDTEALAEDDVVLSIEHDGGVLTTIVASIAAAAEGPRFQVNGDLGGASIDGFDVQEELLVSGMTPSSLGRGWGLEPSDRHVRLMTRDGERAIPVQQGRWQLFYPALVSAVEQGAAVPVEPADAIHTCEIFDAARQSALEGRRIELD